MARAPGLANATPPRRVLAKTVRKQTGDEGDDPPKEVIGPSLYWRSSARDGHATRSRVDRGVPQLPLRERRAADDLGLGT